jgi:hypothetical protein
LVGILAAAALRLSHRTRGKASRQPLLAALFFRGEGGREVLVLYAIYKATGILAAHAAVLLVMECHAVAGALIS